MNDARSDAPADIPSKSQRKRDARALFQLGRKLVELPERQLARIPLDKDIIAAIRFTRTVRSHVARKRELQFLAKLLRRIDATPINAALENLQAEARQQDARHHRVEAWRDRLLEDGDRAVSGLCAQRSDIDIQLLRQLIRNARREKQREKPPASARALFRLLRELDERETLPPLV